MKKFLSLMMLSLVAMAANAVDYYVVGSMNEWAANENYKMVLNEAAQATEYSITLDLTAGAELKVIGVDGETTTWYPDGAGNYTVAEDGKYDIYFRPDADGGDDWYYKTIYLAKVPVISNGTYYIKNVGTEKFLAAGAAWGTHAIVNETGLDYIITAADGKYTIDSQVSNGGNSHYLNGEYNDGGAFQWDIAEVSDGVFTIGNGTQFLTANSDGLVTLGDDATADAAKWTLQTAADRDAANLATLDAATADNGVDATFFIKGANFNRNDLRNNAWTATKSGGNQTIGGPSGDRATYGCESWNNTFEVSQTIENLLEGVYEFTIAGYGTNGTTYIFAGEKEATFVNTESAANFGTALDNIANGDYTGNTTGKVNVFGSTLKVGVKRTSQVGADWAVFDNARLTYYGPIPAEVFKTSFEATLADAAALLDNEDYAVVTGEERTALDQAITDNTTVEDNADAYKAAIQNLEAAMSVFKGAKFAYDGLATAKAFVADLSYEYATAEKKAAAEAAAEAVATNADDATAKTAALYKAYRQYAESSALLEGETATDFTSAIVNPNAESAIAETWSVVLGEGSGGSLSILDGEPWTDGNDNATHKYFDGGNWGAQSWDVSQKQDIKLPKGKYQLTAKMRASADVEQTIFAGEQSAKGNSIGASGGLFNRGWNDTSVEFEMTEAGAITIGVQGVTEKQYNWMSFSDFRLVKFGEYEPVYTVAGGFNTTEGGAEDVIFGQTWNPSIEANNLVKDEQSGEYRLTIEKVALEPGTIYYKVVGEHSWNYASWGFDNKDNGNADYVVTEITELPEGAEATYYDITFRFNPTQKLENGYNVDCVVAYNSEATAITTVNAAEKAEAIYNMAGQQVKNAQKGIFIQNGKKVVKK